MGRGKEPEQTTSNPVEAKKHRDEANGHFKNGNYGRAMTSLDKLNKCIFRIGVKTSIRGCENTLSYHDDHSSGEDIDDSLQRVT
ncbi:unnamed protein product [Danaus chrysippus]|uniref:(African queen) hypothetical protein n=1 Tax=Danaus chrysippus TaxID=151541 RepID=A0A8J2QNV8_9NEOP|nr:unnamed protein product [Danaus chrysippus]